LLDVVSTVFNLVFASFITYATLTFISRCRFYVSAVCEFIIEAEAVLRGSHGP